MLMTLVVITRTFPESPEGTRGRAESGQSLEASDYCHCSPSRHTRVTARGPIDIGSDPSRPC